MLICKNLIHTYKAGKTLSYPDWEVSQGEQALIIGPSGCGKTSLLHLLSGVLKPAKDMVSLMGTDIGSLSQSELDAFRGKHVGFVFQKPHLIAALSVQENISLAAFFGKRKLEKNRILEVLKSLAIEELATKKIHQISQGQAQRVAIARAVVNEPSIIFCDEPTASLDDASCEAVIRLLIDQAKACNATLIMATHDQRVKDQFSNQLEL